MTSTVPAFAQATMKQWDRNAWSRLDQMRGP